MRWPGEIWRRASPASLALDESALLEAETRLAAVHPNTQSFLVARNGTLIWERYYGRATPDQLVDIKSITKRILLNLLGIALCEGMLALDRPIGEWLPGYSATTSHPVHHRTLRDVLCVGSGIKWPRETPPFPLFRRMERSDDWVRFLLRLPGSSRAAGLNEADYHLLSAILHSAAGRSASLYAQERLFTPLGITCFDWPADPRGNAIGFLGLKLRPSDLARLGHLFLCDGIWEERRVLPAADDPKLRGVEHIRGLVPPAPIGRRKWSSARGLGGQWLAVCPELGVVVTVTSINIKRLNSMETSRIAETLDRSITLIE